MTRILIATPTYNSEKTIGRTIHSIIAQQGDFTLDYLVQDGGSTDSTVEICHRYKRLVDLKEVQIFCNSLNINIISNKDKGMYDAIWKAFGTLAGEPDDWIGWINSDDILNPGCLAILAEIDKQHGSNWIKWVGGQTSVIDGSKGLVIGYGERPHNNYAIKSGLCDGYHWDFIQQEGTFFRRQLWESFDNKKEFRDFNYAGDWNLWRLIAQKANLFQVQWPSGSFHREKGQISGELRHLYEAEVNMKVDFRDRTNLLAEMTEQHAVGHAMHTAYVNCEVYTMKTSQVDLLKKWKDKASLRESMIATFYEGAANQILDEHPSLTSLGHQYIAKSYNDESNNFFYLGYKYHWQYPAITEKHAAQKLIKCLNPFNNQIYIAFPWATLIDMIECGDERRHILLSDLGKLVALVPTNTKRVITVCQHILLYKYHKLLSLFGITDVFWSHASSKIGEKLGNIKIYPLPLYPVHHRINDSSCKAHENVEPDILFSFIGATSTHPMRKYIVETLGKDRRGAIVKRDSWHFQELVYGSQINASSVNRINPVQALQDAKNKGDDYANMMLRSKFAICPPGTGPNTIRLWEAIDYGCIPVLISNDLILPGSIELWENAIVLINNDRNSIRAIPQILEDLAKDHNLIREKLAALACIKTVYGKETFVTDIVSLWIDGNIEKNQLNSIKPITTNLETLALARISRISELKVPLDKKIAAAKIILLTLEKSNKDIAKYVAKIAYQNWPELRPIN
jgi:glycosyltransferase involved in cell wall biosynthesis